MILAILVALLVALLGGIVLFLVATATGTIAGIIAGIIKGTAARRAAAAAGVPYPKLTYKQAKAARLARLNATIPGARHAATPAHPTYKPGQDPR